MSDNFKNINMDRPVTGAIDSLLLDMSRNMDFNLDRDKFDFLRLISKTKYSGYTLKNLMIVMKMLQNKEEEWFKELVEDGLAETFNFRSPNGKFDTKWEGWFVTQKGRRIVKEIINKM